MMKIYKYTNRVLLRYSLILIRFSGFSKQCYKMIGSTHFIKQQLKLVVENNTYITLFMKDLEGKIYSVGFSMPQDMYLPK